jgi:hypothetical protein
MTDTVVFRKAQYLAKTLALFGPLNRNQITKAPTTREESDIYLSQLVKEKCKLHTNNKLL